jgi:hypothetical protein
LTPSAPAQQIEKEVLELPKDGLPDLAVVIVTPPEKKEGLPHWEAYEKIKGFEFVNGLLHQDWNINDIKIFARGYDPEFNATEPTKANIEDFFNQFKVGTELYDHVVIYISEHNPVIYKKPDKALVIHEIAQTKFIDKSVVTEFLDEVRSRSLHMNLILNGLGVNRLVDILHKDDGRITMGSYYVQIPLGDYPEWDHFNIGIQLENYQKHDYETPYEEERARLLTLSPPQFPIRKPLL